MSLTASMWSSVSGLLAHGERMNIVGNNISNVNTVAFKGQRMDFQDFVYRSIGTASGPGQTGLGTSVGTIMNSFAQGSFESSTRSTDIAIQGNGFFMVKPLSNNQSYYTRAGNFDFNKDGYLVDPHGYVLQGWNISHEADYASRGAQRSATGVIGAGSPTDIKLDTFTCPPRHTSNITMPVNLPNAKTASASDKSSDAEDPFFSLLKNWDATKEPALGEAMYACQSTLTVYDEGGKQHTLTVYFDRVANKNPAVVDGYTDSEVYWEYIITMEPSEDMRDFSSTYDPDIPPATSPDVPDKLKGLLGAGTLTFSSTGALKDMTAFVPHTNGSNSDHWWTTSQTGEVDVDLSKWVAAPFDSNGYPMFAPNFSGAAGMSQAYQDGIWNQPNANADGRMISLDLGLRNKTNSWQFLGDPAGRTPETYHDSGLPTAAGLSYTGTVHEQKTGVFNKYYIWETNNPNVTLLTKGESKPAQFDNFWGIATPPDNGTWYDWNVNFNGSTQLRGGGTQIVPRTSQNIPPDLVFKRDLANPDDGTYHTWTTSLNGNPVTVTITRGSADRPYLDPGAFDKAMKNNSQGWVQGATPDTWSYTDGDGNTSTITGITDLSDLQSVNWGDPTGSDATKDYYIGTVAGVSSGSQSEYLIEVNTGQNPSCTVITPPVDTDATEYYWYNGNNPDSFILAVKDLSKTRPTLPTITYQDLEDATEKLAPSTNGNKYFLNGMDGMAEVQKTSSTCIGDNFYEINGYKQDGYGSGSLSNVFVSTEGVLSGTYSNGVTLQLYQIVLYDFPSTQNLRREGGNLFSETRESGAPSSGAPGTGSFGTTQGNSLEQSNVDLAREFVNMITTQRGFQANSKTITTVDTMLETVIGMKR